MPVGKYRWKDYRGSKSGLIPIETLVPGEGLAAILYPTRCGLEMHDPHMDFQQWFLQRLLVLFFNKHIWDIVKVSNGMRSKAQLFCGFETLNF